MRELRNAVHQKLEVGRLTVNNALMYGRSIAGWKLIRADVSHSRSLPCCVVGTRVVFARSIIKDDKFPNAISGVLLVEASVGRNSL